MIYIFKILFLIFSKNYFVDVVAPLNWKKIVQEETLIKQSI